MLCPIRTILTTNVAKLLTTALVLPKLDTGNISLYGQSNFIINRLKFLQNNAIPIHLIRADTPEKHTLQTIETVGLAPKLNIVFYMKYASSYILISTTKQLTILKHYQLLITAIEFNNLSTFSNCKPHICKI